MILAPSEVKRAARIAGFWYIVWAISGMFSLLYVPPRIFVPGDPAATGANMLAHELLFKTNILNGLFVIAVTLVLMWALYRLFRQVSSGLAKLMVALIVITLPAGFTMGAFDIAALVIFKGELLTTFSLAQRQDLAMFLFKLNDFATISSMMFWGLWLLPLAILVYRSRFLPRLLGLWLAVNGIAYIAMSITSLLWPIYKDAVFNYSMPAMMGELALAIWLLVRGANVKPLESASQ